MQPARVVQVPAPIPIGRNAAFDTVEPSHIICVSTNLLSRRSGMSRRSTPTFLGKLNFGRALGPLELRIMEVVWRRGPSNVRDVLRALATDDETEIAYTTVMTVMGNLADKGLLQASQVGRTYVYSAVVTRGEFIRKQVKSVLDTLLDGFTEPTLSYFVERLSASDPEQLAELERLIAEERARHAAEEDAT